ncbi:delta(12) fatty acid desaturase-like protein, partial [Tanacetum coccineum]
VVFFNTNKMGAGGQMNVTSDGQNVLKRVPTEKPPFEISDLKKAIPSHKLTHHSFSEYSWLDDAIGFVIHSSSLTPYFSYKYSHRSHHAHTNSIEYDENFVPKRKADTFYSETLNNPLGNLFLTSVKLLLGFPLYFTFNFHGRKYDGFASHFYPQSPIFSDSERKHIWVSDAGVLLAYYALYKVVTTVGASWLFCIYGAPLLVMNVSFLIFTFRQHIHLSLPHYDSTNWDWLRGALSTVDRDYGIFNDVHHNITCAHVVHHLFSSIPHYHLVEATMAIKPILGDYYKYDDTPILKAFWRETKNCIYVEPDGAEKSGVYSPCINIVLDGPLVAEILITVEIAEASSRDPISQIKPHKSLGHMKRMDIAI